MAIVTPGKRPGERIERSRVFGKKFARGKKNGYAGLMLTSLVDMFTIIVIFLLMNFSANGEVLYMSKDIKLPDAYHGAALERAPVISVSGDAVTFDGRMLLNTADLEKGDVLNVPELEDALRDEKRRYEQIHANDPDHPFRGLVNVQADRRIPFKVIKRVMFACNQSGFGNINFAALSREGAQTKTVTASNN
jgi:biopolymer transport protein ExbD